MSDTPVLALPDFLTTIKDLHDGFDLTVDIQGIWLAPEPPNNAGKQPSNLEQLQVQPDILAKKIWESIGYCFP